MRITRSIAKRFNLNVSSLIRDYTNLHDFDGGAASEREEVEPLDSFLPPPRASYPPTLYPQGRSFLGRKPAKPPPPPQAPRDYSNLSKKQIKRIKKRKKEKQQHEAEDEKGAHLSDEERRDYPYGTAPKPGKKRKRDKVAAKLTVSEPQDVSLEDEDFINGLVSDGGYRGTRKEQDDKQYTLAEYEAMEYEHLKDIEGGIDWNGIDPYAIITNQRHGIIFLCGQPEGKTWTGTPGVSNSVPERAAEAMETAAAKMSFDEEHSEHRRGIFRVMANGLSFGGGRKEAGKTKNLVQNQKALDELCNNEAISRIAGFQTACLEQYVPKCHAFYWHTLDKLVEWSKNILTTPFAEKVFAAVTFNFGPKTVCRLHTDDANYIAGWCPVTALGPYNWKKGGHLVIENLKLIIPFPPGATILIPSALLTHANTPIGENERRYSMTQYSASGLFRWVENGMRSDKTFLERATSEQIADWNENRRTRWRQGLRLFPIVSESVPVGKVDSEEEEGESL